MSDDGNDDMRTTMVMPRPDVHDTQDIPLSFDDDTRPSPTDGQVPHGSPRIIEGFGNRLPFVDDCQEQEPDGYAYRTAPMTMPMREAGSFAFNGGDAGVSRKPLLKRPLFWIAFIVIMIALLSMVHSLGAVGASSMARNAPAATSNTMTPEPNRPAGSDAGNDNMDALAKQAGAFDWDSLKGQKLSNAYELMRYHRLDPSRFDISIITNTGGRVLLDSNWTVDSVEYSGDKRLLFHVSKPSSDAPSNNPSKGDADNAHGNADNPIGDLAEKLGGQSTGKDASGIGDAIGKGYGFAKEALKDSIGKASQLMNTAR